MPVHACVDKRVVDDALAILRPRVNPIGECLFPGRRMIRTRNSSEIATRPVDLSGLRFQIVVVIEVVLDQIGAAECGSGAQVPNFRAAFEQQRNHILVIPVQRFFKRRPTARTIDRRAAVE